MLAQTMLAVTRVGLVGLLLVASPVHALTIGCLGDSNTAPVWGWGAGIPPPTPPWCERLRTVHPDWTIINIARVSATVIQRADVDILDGPSQMQGLLEKATPDVVIMAFGTNDIANGVSPAQIVAGYRSLVRQARAAGVSTVLVALTPPRWEPQQYLEATARTNRALAGAFPGVLDFHTGFGRGDFLPDGVHCADAGQAKRLVVVLRALARFKRSASRATGRASGRGPVAAGR